MEKRKIIILILVILLLGGLGTYAYFSIYQKKLISPIGEVQQTPLPLLGEMATWVDQSEFSFQYPKSLKLNPHEEDEDNYAHLELTSATNAGNLVIWVKDTNAKDMEDWVRLTKVDNAIDSQLGSEAAKKILMDDGTQKISVTTIRIGYLYQIEATLIDSAFWNKIYETVISSFKFVEPGMQKKNDSQNDNGAETPVSSDEEFSQDEELIE